MATVRERRRLIREMAGRGFTAEQIAAAIAAPAAPRCPDCGGALQLVTDGEVERVYAPGFHVIGRELPRRVEPLPFLACTGCEYCALVPR